MNIILSLTKNLCNITSLSLTLFQFSLSVIIKLPPSLSINLCNTTSFCFLNYFSSPSLCSCSIDKIFPYSLSLSINLCNLISGICFWQASFEKSCLCISPNLSEPKLRKFSSLSLFLSLSLTISLCFSLLISLLYLKIMFVQPTELIGTET